MSRVKITSDGTALGTKIYVDGVEMVSAISVTFKVSANDHAIATIETYVDEVALDGVIELKQQPLKQQPIKRRTARK